MISYLLTGELTISIVLTGGLEISHLLTGELKISYVLRVCDNELLGGSWKCIFKYLFRNTMLSISNIICS